MNHKLNQIKFAIKSKIYNRVIPRYYKSTMTYVPYNLDSNSKLIVSLTTIPSRINTVWITIESILRQSYRPGKIILWLGQELFKNVELPEELKQQQKRGLEIKFCKDVFCHTKYYYTLKENKEATIITIDDDIIYYKNMIKELVLVSKEFPNCIVCHRAHKILTDNGKIKKYMDWDIESDGIRGPSHMLLQTGVSGVLYPPNSLDEEVLDEKKFLDLCPKADDLWLKTMAILNDTKIVKVKSKSVHYPIISKTQDVALSQNNVDSSGNDIQMNNLFNEYGINLNNYK